MKSLTEFVNENTSPKRFVDVIAFNHDFDFLVLRRANYLKNFRGLWGVVGGSIEKNESAQEAAYRELREETGIKKSQIEEMWKFTEINHENGNVTEVWVADLKESFKPDSIKISGEHAQYKWIYKLDQIGKGKWMPDLTEILEKFIKERINSFYGC